MSDKLALSLVCGILLISTTESRAQDDDDFLLTVIPGIVAASQHSSNGGGQCNVPPQAQAENTDTPDHLIGDGTPQSCTSSALVEAVAQGGIITFNCGTAPVEIIMRQTAKIFNNTGPEIVLDGGNKVTLSGAGVRRILYMNTCDKNQRWTTPHCQNQDHPQLTVQNLTFKNGNNSGVSGVKGGGAIWVRGGRFKIINSRFESNTCDHSGPDVGGGAVRVRSQYEGRPVYIVNSTFGGSPGKGNTCSNGGGLASIGVSYTILNSLFSHNKATGNGANPPKPGTPSGGNGGAIYNDGKTYTLDICGATIDRNAANEGGGGIFFVSNDRSGTLRITNTRLTQNPSAGFETRGYPGIFYLGKGKPIVTNSTIE